MILWHVYPVLTCMSRWGDAPVHSIAAALMLKRSQVHWFYDIGYFHNPWTHCPSEPSWLGIEKCSCDPSNSFGKYTTCFWISHHWTWHDRSSLVELYTWISGSYWHYSTGLFDRTTQLRLQSFYSQYIFCIYQHYIGFINNNNSGRINAAFP